MLESVAGIVGRIGIDAFDPYAVVEKQGLEVADDFTLYDRIRVEKTKGNAGCGSVGIFLAGPGQVGLTLPLEYGTKRSNHYMSQGSGTGDIPRRLIPSCACWRKSGHKVF